MLFANVSVNTPLGPRPDPDASVDPFGRVFTYRVPEALAGRVEPGHLVWCLFRGRRVQAIVLNLTDAAPPFAVQPIQGLVWAQPLLTPTQLTLAQWISRAYLAPLIECLRLMLPAGLTQRGKTVFSRTDQPAPADLTASQAALLARIAAGGGEWADVSARLRGVTQQRDLEPLIDAGLVARETAFPSPPPRPKTDRQVRLLADSETVARVLPTLGRATKQAEALAQLAAAQDEKRKTRSEESIPQAVDSSSVMPLDALCTAAGCGRGPVEALAKRGWVKIMPSRKGESARVGLALEGPALLDALVELRGIEKHRAVLDALARHDGPAWIGWIYAQTGASLDTLRDLESAGLLTIVDEMVWRDPLAGQQFTLDRPPVLTEDQERAWAVIRGRIGESVNQRISASANAKSANGRISASAHHAARLTHHVSPTFLLHGVTGSGKTEIYLRAIAETLKQGRQAVVLVPEIALTPQTIRRFAARFGGQVTVWHSELGEGERFDLWRRVRAGHPAAQVVVGSRSALFLPFPWLGLIVLDEEHEPSYKQERTPRYHARAVAGELGRLCGAPVILGSATPALETYYAAQRGEITVLVLPKRILSGEQGRQGGESRDNHQRNLPLFPGLAQLPEVTLVDMRQELRAGHRSIFSRALQAEMRRVFAAGQQAILYLNRRGAATFVMCRDCGEVESCPRCSVPLTYHGAAGASGQNAPTQLICHHCNRRSEVPVVCARCGSRRIRHFGAGTEVVEQAVNLEFPAARTLRWDRDATGTKGSHDAILTKFVAHEADVLIGTQMIAKGLDLPLVTLVGVVAADVGLFLPDFRAAERTFQLLTQVAGRAGRSTLGGGVVVQTYHPDHYAIVAASKHDYEEFYRQEIGFRRALAYPPLRRLAALVYYHGQRARAEAEAKRVAEQLRSEIARQGLTDTDLIGPAPCFFTRERGDWRWQIVVCSPDPVALLRHVALPGGWRVDVDPVDLL